MSVIDQNKALMSVIARMFSTGETSAARTVFAKDYIDHQRPPFLDLTGPEEFIALVAHARRAEPTLVVSIETILAEGDLVAMRARWQTTGDDGAWRYQESIDILRLEDGQVTEHWGGHS